MDRAHLHYKNPLISSAPRIIFRSFYILYHIDHLFSQNVHFNIDIRSEISIITCMDSLPDSSCRHSRLKSLSIYMSNIDAIQLTKLVHPPDLSLKSKSWSHSIVITIITFWADENHLIAHNATSIHHQMESGVSAVAVGFRTRRSFLCESSWCEKLEAKGDRLLDRYERDTPRAKSEIPTHLVIRKVLGQPIGWCWMLQVADWSLTTISQSAIHLIDAPQVLTIANKPYSHLHLNRPETQTRSRPGSDVISVNTPAP